MSPVEGLAQPAPDPEELPDDCWEELPVPRGLALLVFGSGAGYGSADITGYATAPGDDRPADEQLDEMLRMARRHARRVRGVVVKAYIIADFRDGAR